MRREIKIGLTGIIALVLLFFGIKFLKGMQLFNISNTYYITFEDAKGLTKSSTVFADGFNIGIVSDVIYDYEHPGRVIVAISVDDEVKIPHGTQARLDEAMLGGCTLNMTMGPNPADCYMPEDTIQGVPANGLMASVADVMPKVEQVLAHVDSLILTLNALANNPNLPLMLQNAELITENLNQSTEQLNQLLKKDIPQLTTTFNKAGENAVALTGKLNDIDLQATMNKVNATLANVEQTTQKLNSKDNSLGLLLNDTALYGNMNSTVNSATDLLQDLKQNPHRYVQFSFIGRKNK